jgi:hypothetical protein
MAYTITTGSTALGSGVMLHEDDGDVQALAREYAQRRANASRAESMATVLSENNDVLAEAWADPELDTESGERFPGSEI